VIIDTTAPWHLYHSLMQREGSGYGRYCITTTFGCRDAEHVSVTYWLPSGDGRQWHTAVAQITNSRLHPSKFEGLEFGSYEWRELVSHLCHCGRQKTTARYCESCLQDGEQIAC
jgi:hypothetical protein